jgi:hypothetical protein
MTHGGAHINPAKRMSRLTQLVRAVPADLQQVVVAAVVTAVRQDPAGLMAAGPLALVCSLLAGQQQQQQQQQTQTQAVTAALLLAQAVPSEQQEPLVAAVVAAVRHDQTGRLAAWRWSPAWPASHSSSLRRRSRHFC